ILSFGTLTLRGCTLSGNSSGGPNNSGGGIYNDHGSLTVRDSTLSGNPALDIGAGGGIFHAPPAPLPPPPPPSPHPPPPHPHPRTPRLRPRLHREPLPLGDGPRAHPAPQRRICIGGCHRHHGGSLVVRDSTLSDNSAGVGDGGGINGDVVVTGSTLSGNTAG